MHSALQLTSTINVIICIYNKYIYVFIFSASYLCPKDGHHCAEIKQSIYASLTRLPMRLTWNGLQSNTSEHVLQNLEQTPNCPDIAIKIEHLWSKLEKLRLPRKEGKKRSLPFTSVFRGGFFKVFLQLLFKARRERLAGQNISMRYLFIAEGLFLGLFHFEWTLAEGKAYRSQLLKKQLKLNSGF